MYGMFDPFLSAEVDYRHEQMTAGRSARSVQRRRFHLPAFAVSAARRPAHRPVAGH